MYNTEKKVTNLQITSFNPMHEREIYAAFEICYTNGIKHPDRAMRQHDFVYFLEGEWEIYQGNHKYLARKNDVIILTANSHHYGLVPCQDKTKNIYIHTSAAPCELLNNKNQSGNFIPLSPLIHCGKHSDRIKRDFERIVENFSLNRTFKNYRLQNAFHTLLIDLYDAQNSQGSYTDTELVEKICQQFIDVPDKFFSNKELALIFNIGEKTFTEKFKKITGKTLYQYQIEYKLQNIKTIMSAYPEITLHELAVNNGFCDEFHLSKTFKKHFGQSPYNFKKITKFN